MADLIPRINMSIIILKKYLHLNIYPKLAAINPQDVLNVN